MNNSTTIYTASAIDLAKSADYNTWRDTLCAFLQLKAVTGVIFDPKNAFKSMAWGHINLLRSTYIELINKAALEEADIFVALVDKNMSSIGVPIEIDMAHKLGKKMFVLTNIKPGESAYLDNRVDVSGYIYNDLSNAESAIESLAEVISHYMVARAPYYSMSYEDEE